MSTYKGDQTGYVHKDEQIITDILNEELERTRALYIPYYLINETTGEIMKSEIEPSPQQNFTDRERIKQDLESAVQRENSFQQMFGAVSVKWIGQPFDSYSNGEVFTGFSSTPDDTLREEINSLKKHRYEIDEKIRLAEGILNRRGEQEEIARNVSIKEATSKWIKNKIEELRERMEQARHDK